MPVTLTITDNANGSTATAEIAGSGASDTNTLFKAAWTGDASTLSFSSAGSRTGDGNITASTAAGLWFWKLESVVTATSSKTVVITYGPTSNTAAAGDPVHKRVMDQVQTQIRALALTGMTSANVVIKWLPRQYDTTTDPVPAIIISPGPTAEQMPQDLNSTDKVHYPVLITIVDKLNRDFTANLSRDLKWREKINREFRYRALTGISEIIHALPAPKQIIDPSWFQKNCLWSSFMVYFVSRETRGN